MSDEQRVRTEAGWIGVDISRSRVRTPGKTGFGLYRVRSAAERHWHVPHPVVVPAGQWTAYAYSLESISQAVRQAIALGVPDRPGWLTTHLVPEPEIEVPTRWTSGYAGRRDLGADLERLERDDPEVARAAAGYERMSEEVRGTARGMDALTTLVGAGLIEMRHVDGCACDVPRSFTAACVTLTQARTMPRQVQRDANAAFQAAHAPARAAGKAGYYARRLSGGQTTGTEGTQP